MNDFRFQPLPVRAPAVFSMVRDDGRSAGRAGNEPFMRNEHTRIAEPDSCVGEREQADAGDETLDARRIAELRARVDARFHDDPRVIDEVARRMIERGDL
jgi:hypothetical protein